MTDDELMAVFYYCANVPFQRFCADLYPGEENIHYLESKHDSLRAGTLYLSLDPAHRSRFRTAVKLFRA